MKDPGPEEPPSDASPPLHAIVADSGVTDSASSSCGVPVTAEVANTSNSKEPRGKKRRGRPAKNNKLLFNWTEVPIKALLEVRYVELSDRFANSRSNQNVEENMEMLASEVARRIMEEVDPEQCRNKVKHLARLWTAYNEQLNRTGMDPLLLNRRVFRSCEMFWETNTVLARVMEKRIVTCFMQLWLSSQINVG